MTPAVGAVPIAKSRPAGRNNLSNSTLRDAPSIASEVWDPLQELSAPTRSGRSLLDVADRRKFHPLVSGPQSSRRWRVPLLLAPARAKGSVTRQRHRSAVSVRDTLQFKAPEAVLVCVRRKRRREVIHAKGVAGGRVRRPRRNAFSSVSCRRR